MSRLIVQHGSFSFQFQNDQAFSFECQDLHCCLNHFPYHQLHFVFYLLGSILSIFFIQKPKLVKKLVDSHQIVVLSASTHSNGFQPSMLISHFLVDLIIFLSHFASQIPLLQSFHILGVHFFLMKKRWNLFFSFALWFQSSLWLDSRFIYLGLQQKKPQHTIDVNIKIH